MARIRTVKPEFWTDEKVGDCSITARLLFVASWNFADDYGGLDRSAKQLKAQAFPYDNIDCEPLVLELIAAGLFVEYEVGGKRYLHIHGFRKHQKVEKPAKPRIPLYDENCIDVEDSPTSSGDSPTSNGSSLGREGKGREGKGATAARETPGLNLEAWERWIAYRVEIRHALKDASMVAAAKSLAAFHGEQSAVVEQSVANGWQGLFALKSANGRGQPNAQAAAAWDKLLATSGAARDGPASKALEAIGGWQRVRMRTDFDAAKIKSEFCHAYGTP